MFRHTARILIVLLAAPVVMGSGPPEPVAEATSDMGMTKQKHDLAELEAHAAKLSKKGTPEFDPLIYYSIVRQGLALMAERDPSSSDRSEGNWIKDLKPDVIADLDGRKDIQKRLDELMQLGTGMRIVGGKLVQPFTFMPTVAIANGEGETGCSGTVISVDNSGGWVLTAAHCICEFRLQPGGNGDAIIRFGNPVLGVNTKWRSLDTSKTRLFEPQFCQRYWTNNRNICDVDLAVLRYTAIAPAGGNDLPYPAFAPARFPNATKGIEEIAYATELVGFGDADIPDATRTNGVRSLKLGPVNWKKSAFVRRSNAKCSSMPYCTSTTHGCLADSSEVVIADARWDADTCSGDSGGSVYSVSGDETNRRLLAVTSRAIDGNGKCGPGGIYVKAFSPPVIKWLRDDLHINISVDP